MPALAAYLSGQSLTGSTTWRISTLYDGHGRGDNDSFPGGSGRVLSAASTWDIRSEFGGALRGGTATISYRYNSQPERSFTFQIRGANPVEADAKSRLGGSPWFLTRIARQESGIRQFNGGDPLFGAPNGWGIMQVDPPPGPQEIWNWAANVDAGKGVINQKNSELTTTWNNRLNDWATWNQQHPPNQQVGPPAPRQEGGCNLQWVGGGSGSEGSPSFRDACWIKRYNGADNSDFLIWENRPPYQNDPRWVFIPTRSDGLAYVAGVCSQNP